MKKLLSIIGGIGWLGSLALLMGAAVIGYQDFQTRGTPGNPSSGFMRIWADTGSSTFKCLTSGGASCTFASATSGTVTSVSGTSPLTGTVTGTGSLACATCVTSAASLTSSAFMMGAGSQGSQTVTAATATAALNAFTSSLQGVAPSSGGGTSNFLRADGSWAAPSGSGGTVTSVATTSPLGGGTITGAGTLTCTTCTVTIASGTSALGTSAISSNACATVVTTGASGVATTDNIMADFNSDPSAVTGYVAGSMLTIIKYPTANNVNFLVCNNTSGSLTPGARTLNWRVVR